MELKNILDILNSFTPEDEREVLTKLENNPRHVISMFKKTIIDYFVIRDQTVKLIKKQHPDLNEKDLQKAGDHLTYVKAFEILVQLDVKNLTHLKYLQEKPNAEFMKCANDSLLYFERIEDYDKCIYLRDLLNNLV